MLITATKKLDYTFKNKYVDFASSQKQKKSNAMINRQSEREREKNKNQSQVYLLAVTNRLAEENNNQSDLEDNHLNAANFKKVKKWRERERVSQDGDKMPE